MLSFFSDILGYLDVIGDFIANIWKTTFMALNVMMNSITVLIATAGFVPTIISVSVSIGLVLYVIKFILGR